jgi:hypothetical protein
VLQENETPNATTSAAHNQPAARERAAENDKKESAMTETNETTTITPRKSITTSERYKLTVNVDDVLKMSRGESRSAVMTDIPSGQKYTVRGAPCSIPTCFCDAVATPITEARTETIYHDCIFIGVDDLGAAVEAGDAIVELENIRDAAEDAIELLKTDGVELIDADWDKHAQGYTLIFETTDESVARERGFWEMLPPPGEGEDQDDVDFELTPWKREGEAYRALIKAVGEEAAKTLGGKVFAQFPTDEVERAKAYEVLAAELAPKQSGGAA